MAASSVVGVLRALLTLDSAEFESASKRAAGEAKKLTKDLNDIGRQASALGASLTKTVTLPIIGLGTAAAKAAIDFQSSFAGIGKTVDGVMNTSGDLTEFGKDLAQSFRNLSKELPISVNELNKVGEAAGQLGIEKENLVSFTKVMAQLGATTNLSAEEAAVSLAQLANITGMSEKDFDRLGSTIVGLGNKFATNEQKIVDFGLRIAGAGKLAGLSEPQILAIGTAMASVGVEAEAGGTAVQKVLNDMTAAVATGNESLAVFAQTAGLSARDFAKAFKEDAGQAFLAFVEGLGKQGDRAFKTLDDLKLGNERVVRAFLSVANAGDLTRRALNEAGTAWRENTALTEEAQKRFSTVKDQLTILWNRIKDVGITIGEALLPFIKKLIAATDQLLPVVDFLAKGFASLNTPMQMGIIAAGLFAAAIGPLIFAFGQLAFAASSLTGAFAANGIATRALAASQGVLAGTSTALSATLLRLAGTVGIYGAAMAAGAAIGMAHDERMRRMAAAGQDLDAVTKKLADTEAALARARANGNDKLEYKLAAEVKALQAAKKSTEAVKDQAQQEEYAANSARQWARSTGQASDATVTLGTTTPRATAAVKAFTAATVDLVAAQREIVRITSGTARNDWLGADAWMRIDLGRMDAYNAKLRETAELMRGFSMAGIPTTQGPGGLNLPGTPLPLPAPPTDTSWMDSWISGLDKVGSGFQRLSQIAGDSMSKITRAIGTALESLNSMLSGLSSMASGNLMGAFSFLGGIMQLGKGWVGGQFPAFKFIQDFLRDRQQVTDDAEAQRLANEELLNQDISGLGLGFEDRGDRAQGLLKEGQALLDQRKRLIDGGFEEDRVLSAQAEKWSKLYQIAMEFGLDIPPSMRSVLAELSGMGLLLDAAGNKVTDLSGKNQAALAKMAADIKKFDEEIAGLQASIAGEAEEEEMGVIERETRAKIAALEEERAKAKQNYDELAEQSKKAAQDWVEVNTGAGDQLYGYLTDLFGKGIEIKLSYKLPDGMPGFPGAESVPVYDRPLERVTNAGWGFLNRGDVVGMPALTPELWSGGGGTPVVLMVNDRELGRAIVPSLPKEARRLGVRVRS